MEEHGEITPKEAETITGKSAATVRRYFKMLADTRYIVAEGSTNNIVYRISMNLSEDDKNRNIRIELPNYDWRIIWVKVINPLLQ